MGEDVDCLIVELQVCFVGIDRTYPLQNEAVVEVRRQKFLQQRCTVDPPSFVTDTDVTHTSAVNDVLMKFVPRLPSEPTRNAVAVDNSSKQLITTTVMTEILSCATNLVILQNKTWNKGGIFGKHIVLC